MDERISGIKETIKEIDTLTKENVTSKIFLTQSIPGISNTMKRSKLRIIRPKEGKESQTKGPDILSA